MGLIFALGLFLLACAIAVAILVVVALGIARGIRGAFLAARGMVRSRFTDRTARATPETSP